jgi:hypothetical protein
MLRSAESYFVKEGTATNRNLLRPCWVEIERNATDVTD